MTTCPLVFSPTSWCDQHSKSSLRFARPLVCYSAPPQGRRLRIESLCARLIPRQDTTAYLTFFEQLLLALLVYFLSLFLLFLTRCERVVVCDIRTSSRQETPAPTPSVSRFTTPASSRAPSPSPPASLVPSESTTLVNTPELQYPDLPELAYDSTAWEEAYEHYEELELAALDARLDQVAQENAVASSSRVQISYGNWDVRAGIPLFSDVRESEELYD